MTEIRKVTLTSRDKFGTRVPAGACGQMLRVLPNVLQYSIRMAFEGRSSARGRLPQWLTRASDIRFTGIEGERDTVLVFEAPRLIDTAYELYEQTELWNALPEETDTGFDVASMVIDDIASDAKDSDRFDRTLLQQIGNFGRALNGSFQSLEIEGTHSKRAVIDRTVLARAEALSSVTPTPRRVRIMGRLDMIRASTKAFGIILPTEEEVRCVLHQGDLNRLADLFEKNVLVIGDAVYRPSGSLLRIDAHEIRSATSRDEFFGRIPKHRPKELDMRSVRRQLHEKEGVSAVIGRWPGSETEEEFERLVRELV